MTRRLECIGGPFDGEWVHDTGRWHYAVAAGPVTLSDPDTYEPTTILAPLAGIYERGVLCKGERLADGRKRVTEWEVYHWIGDR